MPEAQRRYGYYVFPVLQGDRVIGRLDARRMNGSLEVRAFWPEEGVRMGKARGSGLMSELERLSVLAGVEGLGFATDCSRIKAYTNQQQEELHGGVIRGTLQSKVERHNTTTRKMMP